MGGSRGGQGSRSPPGKLQVALGFLWNTGKYSRRNTYQYTPSRSNWTPWDQLLPPGGPSGPLWNTCRLMTKIKLSGPSPPPPAHPSTELSGSAHKLCKNPKSCVWYKNVYTTARVFVLRIRVSCAFPTHFTWVEFKLCMKRESTYFETHEYSLATL